MLFVVLAAVCGDRIDVRSFAKLLAGMDKHLAKLLMPQPSSEQQLIEYAQHKALNFEMTLKAAEVVGRWLA